MRWLLIVVPALLCVTVALASAEPTVLAVDGEDIYVDLGAADGVGAGSELELLHEVVARDPQTGAVLRDRFALGRLRVVKSGERLSVVVAEPTLAERVLAGDRVRLVSPKRAFVDPWVAQVVASRAAAAAPGPAGPPGPPTSGAGPTPSTPRTGAVVDHVALAREAWLDTLGQPPERRIARWQALIEADPKSPYRRVIENEIASLTDQIRQREDALAKARSADDGDRDPRIAALVAELEGAGALGDVLAVAPLARAIPNRPIELGFLVRQPAALHRAWLYVRPQGEPGYRRIELVRDGDAYLRGTIEAAAVKEGTLAWYVEAVAAGPDAEVAPVLGSAADPRRIEIDAEVVEAPIAAERSHVHAHVDYVDFDGSLATGFDQYYQAEIDFMYRFLHPVYAVRLGFGTLSGTGGPRDVIDEDPMGTCFDGDGVYRCRQVTFSYVYTEVELRLRRNVALMLRPQAGLLTTDTSGLMEEGRCRGADTTDCRFSTGVGGRVRARFGEERGTNLVIGVGFTDGVGTLLEAAYHWLPHTAVPVQLSVQVTDQPVPENFGVRLIGDVGWRSLSWFYPSLRISYQARDIDHAGVSGGFAMNFDW